MNQEKESSQKLTTRTGTPVPDNQNIQTAGVRGPEVVPAYAWIWQPHV